MILNVGHFFKHPSIRFSYSILLRFFINYILINFLIYHYTVYSIIHNLSLIDSYLHFSTHVLFIPLLLFLMDFILYQFPSLQHKFFYQLFKIIPYVLLVKFSCQISSSTPHQIYLNTILCGFFFEQLIGVKIGRLKRFGIIFFLVLAFLLSYSNYLLDSFFLLVILTVYVWDFKFIKNQKLLIFSLVLNSFALWCNHNFGFCQIEQVANLFMYANGLSSSPVFLFFYFFLQCIICPIFLISFFQFLHRACLYGPKRRSIIFQISCILTFICVLTYFFHPGFLQQLYHFSPLTYKLLVCGLLLFFLSVNFFAKRVLPLFIFFWGLFSILCEFQINNLQKFYYFNDGTTNDLFAKAYRDPKKVYFSHSNPLKSLVLIYVESLEFTYRDANLFGRNLLKPLDDLNYKKFSFNHFSQISNTGWTMAGILSSQCGVPYNFIIPYSGNRTGEILSKFMPNALCLGDILHANGYTNVFLSGSDLSFSGRIKFLNSHHYEQAFGKYDWLKKGYHSSLDFWGLPDDTLFSEAKVSLNALMQKDKPFNLTILTIDTHGMSGRLSRSCLSRQGKNFSDIVECTSQEVADFVNYIAQKGWLDKVNIVITGDHLAMENSVSNLIKKKQTRYIYNLFITTDETLVKNRDNIVHFDLLPTILQSLGFRWENDRLGLGHSAVGPTPLKVTAAHRNHKLERIVASRSKVYEHLWF